MPENATLCIKSGSISRCTLNNYLKNILKQKSAVRHQKRRIIFDGMNKKETIRILSISQYGSGLTDPKNQFSGAMDRQKDYASFVERYDVVAPSERPRELFTVTDNLTIYPVQATGTLQFLIKMLGVAVRLYRDNSYDVIMVDNPHLMGLCGILLKWRTGTKLVVHSMADIIHNPWYRKERPSNYLKDLCIRLVMFAADYIRVSTAAEMKRLKSYNQHQKKVFQVSFYIDADDFKSKLTGMNREPKQLLFVGRLGHQKDIPTLLKSMPGVLAEHPEARLVIVGDGPLRNQLEQLAEQLGIAHAVRFTLRVPYKDVAQYFSLSEAFVISSLYEGTCMVLHEAAVAKLPVVSTGFAGALDFVRDGDSGYVTDIRNVKKFTDAINSLLNNPQAAKEMGQRAYERLPDFSREKALLEWQTLLAEIIADVAAEQSTNEL